jgi:hypothetical protein
MYQTGYMKKGTLLILTYTLVVVALVVSVKLVQIHAIHNQATHEALIADCNDPNPGPTSSE